jgi:hypothetical protein
VRLHFLGLWVSGPTGNAYQKQCHKSSVCESSSYLWTSYWTPVRIQLHAVRGRFPVIANSGTIHIIKRKVKPTSSPSTVYGLLSLIFKSANPWPESASELYRPSDRRLSEKLVPTFAVRGQHNGSLRPYSRFSRPEPLLFLSSSSSIVFTRLIGARSRPTTSFLVVPGI